MSIYPLGFKYTKDHAWMERAGEYRKIGITQYAQRRLGDVVYVACSRVGESVEQGQSIGTIESTDAVLELYSPVSGEVVRVNALLRRKPEVVNSDPHETWIIVLKLKEPSESDVLLDAFQYAQFVGTLCDQW